MDRKSINISRTCFILCMILILYAVPGRAAAAPAGNATYTVTLNANGGTGGNTSKNVIFGNTYGALPVPVRNGYIFQGWYTYASGGVKITESSTVKRASNHTIYAHWLGEEREITLDANGGELAGETFTVRNGSKFYYSLPTPKKKNYKFAGWYTSLTGGESVKSNSVYDETSAKTFYAHWTGKTLKITFFGLNNEEPYVKNAGYGKEIGELPQPERDGYTFAGWYFWEDYKDLRAEGITSGYIVTEYTPAKIFARWLPEGA